MGDLPGHEFRGNQYATAGSGSFGGKLAGVRVPSLHRGEVHLVRYSESPEHETGVGRYAHAGRKLDDLIEASSYYAKGGNLVADAAGKITSEPHRGFLTIGRASAAAARESEAGWSNGDTYREVRGVLRKENIDAVVNVATGEVVYRRQDYTPAREGSSGSGMPARAVGVRSTPAQIERDARRTNTNREPANAARIADFERRTKNVVGDEYSRELRKLPLADRKAIWKKRGL